MTILLLFLNRELFYIYTLYLQLQNIIKNPYSFFKSIKPNLFQCYWIEKLEPFTKLPPNDRSALFKRYSVRKLSLDHFFVASKFPSYTQSASFMMNNNKFVPSYLTGFETNDDTELSRKAKYRYNSFNYKIYLNIYRLLRPTIDLCLQLIIKPFYELDIGEVEIVALQILLMWSTSNQQHVTKETWEIMQERRNWVIKRLYDHYARKGYIDPEVRVGEVILLLCEIEVVSNNHCKDFQVAQLFKCGKMDDFWYEQVCYNMINYKD